MKRLDKIVSFVDENKIVADIGSDHGISAIKVYEEKSPRKVIATDISGPSLQKLVDKLEQNNYEIETIITDGLKGLPLDIDQIIISGMGGHLVTEIIEGNFELSRAAEKLILSPNNSKNYFRRWLHENSFEIITDEKVEDEKIIYDVIVARSSEKVKHYEDDLHYEYGKENIESKDLLTIKQIEQEIEVERSIADKLINQKTEVAMARRKELLDSANFKEKIVCKLKS